MRLAVVGMGYVGLTLSLHLAEKGHKIYGYEINKIPMITEDGLEALIKKHLYTNIVINEKPEDLDAAIIAVGTPVKKGKIDSRALESALGRVSGMGCPIILRSTVAIGTMDKYVKYMDKAYCPERTAEGSAVAELKTIPQIISASNAETLKVCKKIFDDTEPICTDTFREAEAAKLICNVYRDMNFALGNLISESVQAYGLDYNKIWSYATQGYPRGNISKEGFVGGACLTKDSYIFAEGLNRTYSKMILKHRKFNRSLERKVIKWIKKNIPAGSRVCLSGMAFKGNPDNADIRDSSAVNIANKLYGRYVFTLHDFNMHTPSLHNQYDAVVILNNNYRYKNMRRLNTKIVFDAYNMLGGKTTLGNFLCTQ